ncbi:hypothetical protein SCLCIDRAFT_1225500, partial [Scleroderma citrinum Foug A]
TSIQFKIRFRENRHTIVATEFASSPSLLFVLGRKKYYLMPRGGNINFIANEVLRC